MRHQPNLQVGDLLLRPFDPADGPDVQRLAGEREIADKTLNIPHPYPDGQAEEWISTHRPKFEADELCVYAVTQRYTGELMGAIGLRIERAFDRAEMGYWMGIPYWNHGYCTLAGRAILAYGFIDLRLHRIYAHHLSRNPASGKVMQKIGMTWEGRLRGHTKKREKHEDLEVYGILREEWSGVAE